MNNESNDNMGVMNAILPNSETLNQKRFVICAAPELIRNSCCL